MMMTTWTMVMMIDCWRPVRQSKHSHILGAQIASDFCCVVFSADCVLCCVLFSYPALSYSRQCCVHYTQHHSATYILDVAATAYHKTTAAPTSPSLRRVLSSCMRYPQYPPKHSICVGCNAGKPANLRLVTLFTASHACPPAEDMWDIQKTYRDVLHNINDSRCHEWQQQ